MIQHEANRIEQSRTDGSTTAKDAEPSLAISAEAERMLAAIDVAEAGLAQLEREHSANIAAANPTEKGDGP